MQVSAIIPAYNEEGWVGKTVLALRELPEINEIIVVDDGSRTDLSGSLNAGATVCRFSSNRGKSRALREGVALARGDVLAFVDADLCETALQFRRLISCIAADRADMAIASFGAKGKRGLGLVRALAYWGIRYHTGQSMNTPLSGQRVLKRVLWDSLNFRAEGFAAEVALTIESLKKGFRVIEIPLEMNHRVWGNDYASFMHRGEQLYDLVKLFWKKEY